MAQLKIKGEFVGPGEERTARTLERELPDDWVIFAGRKLQTKNRDDVDLLIVGRGSIWVVDEKAWGPRVVVGDRTWLVKDEPRHSPMDRTQQLARVLAGLLNKNVRGYSALRGHRVLGAVILSHPSLTLLQGARHEEQERIYALQEAAAHLVEEDAGYEPLGAVRGIVIKYLDDMPSSQKDDQIGGYRLQSRLAMAGIELAYRAIDSSGTEVILKCYPVDELRALGDPTEFMQRETKALNRLASTGRTWPAHPCFEDDTRGLMVVPVVQPHAVRNLLTSIRTADPERPSGLLSQAVATHAVTDAFVALQEVHDEGLLHRALHPSRVWLGKQLRVQFSDLHLARLPDSTTISLWAPDHDISNDYAAPEAAVSIGTAGPKSDVFSLALCMIHWLLGGDPTELTRTDIKAELDAKYSWASPLLDALDPSPSKRPSAKEVAGRIQDVVSQITSSPPMPDNQFEIGGVIENRYRIEQLLGTGGTARTWLVMDQQQLQRRVLKEFHPHLSEKALAEFQVADSLTHERCGRVYDVNTRSAPRFLVSEYVHGLSLGQLGPEVSVELIRAVGIAISHALEYIHGKGLLHRDVTPSNIIVPDGDGESAKLIDFGITSPLSDEASSWTPRFAAPEVWRGGHPDQRSDLFGLAASLLYAMLGRSVVGEGGVVSGPTQAEIDQWGAEGAVLLRVLSRAVSEDPELRPQSAAQFRSELMAASPLLEDEHDHERSPQVNPNVSAIRRLFRGSRSGNAGNRGLDDEFARLTYIDTKLDTQLLPQVLAGGLDLVILSGNPGDGKTAFLVKTQNALRERGAHEHHADDAGFHYELAGHFFYAVFDASESHGSKTSDDLMRSVLDPVLDAPPGTATALLAANDGRLRQFFTDNEAEYEDWALALRSAGRVKDPRLALVDLKHRSLSSFPGDESFTRRLTARFTEDSLWRQCDACVAQPSCPIFRNREWLRGDAAESMDELVLTSHLRRRRRATFRDLRSALAWTITGDRDCHEIHRLREEGLDPRQQPNSALYDLAFSQESGDYLVQEWADLDPGLGAAPDIDQIRRERHRRPAQGESDPDFAGISTHAAFARSLYFGVWGKPDAPRQNVRAYRHLLEFVDTLRHPEGEERLSKLLLGISRLLGAHGYQEAGLAMRSGMPGADWAILHTVDEAEFSLVVPQPNPEYVEGIPDHVVLNHSAGPQLRIGLDAAEIILRAAEGEIVNSMGADAIIQEIESFVSQLARQPAASAFIVDGAGSVSTAIALPGGVVALEGHSD